MDSERSASGISLTVRRSFARALRGVTEHPLTTVITSLGLIGGGVMELTEEFVPNFEHVLGVHHGVIVFGLVGMLRGLAELAEGAEKAAKHPGLLGAAEAEATAAPDGVTPADVAPGDE